MCVIHQAAQIDVRVSVHEPALDASINLVGFANILAGVAAGKVKRVVFASSGGVVYGDPAVIPTPEPTANLPISPYGVSKLAGEHYLRVLGSCTASRASHSATPTSTVRDRTRSPRPVSSRSSSRACWRASR